MVAGPPFKLAPELGALMVALLDVMALRELAAPELLETGATHLAAFLGDTCIVSLLTEDRRWLRPLGFADPDPKVVAVLARARGERWRADRGFTRPVIESLRPLRLPQTSPEVVLVGRPELADYAHQFGISSLIVAPMRAAGRPAGHVAAIRQRAGAPFTEADERVTQTVADLLAVGVNCTAALATIDADAAAGEPQLDLTTREREVLSLLAIGHTNREIAEKLFLSVRTVEWHRARIQWKLGVSGRAALAGVARAHGLAG
jgi:DNA-binding NarL/FixJ family response regulator